ncbi:HAD family phosphatase [Candidatus Shapirobacteria bacterium]|nr:HAD family phosphatase [Candidatus Shapirobacteria bacterium]
MKNKKSIALFDIDKTIYNDHSFFAAAKFLINKGILSSDTWTKIETELGKYTQKIQTYSFTANNLLNIFVEALAGKAYDEVMVATKEFFDQNQNNFYPYFKNILPTLRQTHEIYLVTTNSQNVAEVVKNGFGLDGYLCTNFEVVGGIFTGKVLNSLADGKHVVEELVAKYDGNTMAFGDSENDIGMLEKVKTPVCINPSPELLAHAQKNNWLVVSDSTAETEVLKIISKLS